MKISVPNLTSKKILYVFTLLFILATQLSAQEIRLEDIEFKGNENISSGTLELAMESKANPWYRLFLFWVDSKIYDEEVFLTDLLRIERFYQQEGYLNAHVLDYQLDFNGAGDEVSIKIIIDEGRPTMVGIVSLVFQPPDTTGKVDPKRLQKRLKLKNGRLYRELDLKNDYQAILDYLSNTGYPYVQVRVKPELDSSKINVNLEWRIKPGLFCKFGEISYSGNKNISAKVIKRGLGFSTGETFKRKKLLDSQQQVYRLELFEFASLTSDSLDGENTLIPISVKIKEAKLHTIKFGLGYGTEERFRGFARARWRNFFGGGRILRLNAKHSTEILPIDLELELSQPYFLSNRNDLILRPFFKWQDETSFEARRLGVDLTLSRRLTRKTNAFFSTIVERDTVRLKGDIVDDEVEDLFNKSVFRVGLSHNSTDQIFTPSRGQISSIYVEEAGRLLATPFKYLKVFTEHRFYRKLSGRNILAAKFSIGSMKAIRGTDATPTLERFFAGGNYSLRGWKRQELGPSKADSMGRLIPVGGNSIIDGSVELRYSLFSQFVGAVFLDYGNVWEKWNGFAPGDLRYALGLGLRYNTLIGPVRVDVAWKLNEQEQDDQGYEIHFSIGQAF